MMSSAAALGGFGLGGAYWTQRWNYIVIHHSAGSHGDIAFLNRVHSERQAGDPIDAIPYHYVIGNGNGLAMGEVASDWRQGYDIWGAHVSGRNTDWNFRGIGVCLIGNFENHEVPPPQYQALLKLTRQLMSDYAIPVANVNGHGYIAGEATKCPGKHFPMERFLSELRTTV
jgi:N-acetyl-anhydromuramyl-L-alanine amidase AmpD